MNRVAVLGLTIIAAISLSVFGQAKTLNWNLETDPLTLDPSLATDAAATQLVHALFLGLTDFDDDTMAIVPRLATDWETSEDGLTWTFHMRRNAMWFDGTPVTAYDVVFGVRRTLNPDTNSPTAYLLYVIKGAEAYNSGAGSADAVGVRGLDNYTVQFTLERPAGYFPYLVAMPACYPQPQTIVEDYGNAWILPEHIVSDGPYSLGDWARGDHIVLYKSFTYYGLSDVKIDQIYCYIIGDEEVALDMYEKGKLDVAAAPADGLDQLKADPAFSSELHATPYPCTYYYGFNNDKPPFDNLFVRKAFAAAIDRQSLVSQLLGGAGVPAKTFTCPGVFGYVDGAADQIGIPYDPPAAADYLAEAGYPNGAGFPEVTLMYNSSSENEKIAGFVSQAWEETLHVKVNVVAQPWSAYMTACATDAPQIFRMMHCADYPDADNFLREVFDSTSSMNYGHFSDPTFDETVARASQASDPDVRRTLYEKAETILCRTDCAIIPIYFSTDDVLTKPYVVRTYASFGGEKWENWDIVSH